MLLEHAVTVGVDPLEGGTQGDVGDLAALEPARRVPARDRASRRAAHGDRNTAISAWGGTRALLLGLGGWTISGITYLLYVLILYQILIRIAYRVQ